MIKDTMKILLKNIKKIIKFEFIFKLLTVLIFIPLFLNTFKLIMKLTGYSYLTLENIGSFILKPITLILLTIFLLMMSFYSLFDIGTIIILLDASKQNKNINLKTALTLSLKKSLTLFKPKNFELIVYILFLIPFLNLGTGSSLISTIKMPEFIEEYIYSNTKLSVLYFLLLVLLGFLVSRWIYSMHYFFLEDKTFRESRKLSRNLIKKNQIKDSLILLCMQIIFYIIFILFIVLGILLILLLNKVLKQVVVLESILITLVGIFLLISLVVFNVLESTFMYSFISVLFYKHKTEKKERIIHIDIKNKNKSIEKSKWRIIKYGLILFTIIELSFFTYGVIKNKYNINIEYVRKMEITAHRGASVKYPENTFSAFIGAKDLGADWIELDVQQTKDRKIIVSHDTNLKRITGKNLNIWESSYDEIKKLDVGSFKDKKFNKERIPLLEDVIKWAKKNNMRLNIELKPTGYETKFEEQVVELIKKYNFENDCVITSQMYEVLENVKKCNEGITTVYVMSLAFGNITKLNFADYFSVEATSINKNMVNRIHNEGKQIYAWTVNTEESINNMINLNVDNIITDDIVLGKKLVSKSKKSNLIVELIKVLTNLF